MDKRKNNGNKGHSTKAKGIDKRKNEYKSVLENALTHEDLQKVVKMLYGKAINDFDVPASKILLEYYLGKPKETIETTNLHVNSNDLTIDEIKKINETLNNAY